MDETEWVDAMGERVQVQCPYCFEMVEILLDAETEGSLVQDCEVCCHPWQLTIERHRGAPSRVQVDPL